MSNINDNILDTRKIEGSKTNNYELRMYIHEEALNWMGKHYHYKVVLNNSNQEDYEKFYKRLFN